MGWQLPVLVQHFSDLSINRQCWTILCIGEYMAGGSLLSWSSGCSDSRWPCGPCSPTLGCAVANWADWCSPGDRCSVPGMFLGRMYLRRWGNRLNTACLSTESQGGEALKSPEIRKLVRGPGCEAGRCLRCGWSDGWALLQCCLSLKLCIYGLKMR